MIIFPVGREHKGSTPLFRQLLLSDFDFDNFDMDLEPDFGDISRHHASRRYEETRSRLLSDMDNEKIPFDFYFDEELDDREQTCRRVNWFSKTYPTCNAVHELAPVLFDVRRNEKEVNVTYLQYVFFTCGIELGLYYTILDSSLIAHMLVASSFSAL